MNRIKISPSIFRISLLIMLTSCSFVVLAQNVLKPNIKQQSVPHLFYLGVKSGEVNYQDACEDSAIHCDKKDSAWSGFLGYQFHPNWSVEVGYNDFGQVTAQYPDKEIVSQYVGTMKGGELSLKGQRMLSENITVFSKIGTLKWNGNNIGPYSSRTDNDWAPMAGIGLGYKLTSSWGARIEYQYFDGVGSELLGGSNIHFISLGVLYRFGQKK